MPKITFFVSGYAMTKDTIYCMRVCNNSTIKRIKLVTDFLHLLHKEENLQHRVFIAEDNLRKISNLRKRPFQFVQCGASALLLHNFCPLKYTKNIALPVKSVELKIQKASSN